MPPPLQSGPLHPCMAVPRSEASLREDQLCFLRTIRSFRLYADHATEAVRRRYDDALKLNGRHRAEVAALLQVRRRRFEPPRPPRGDPATSSSPSSRDPSSTATETFEQLLHDHLVAPSVEAISRNQAFLDAIVRASIQLTASYWPREDDPAASKSGNAECDDDVGGNPHHQCGGRRAQHEDYATPMDDPQFAFTRLLVTWNELRHAYGPILVEQPDAVGITAARRGGGISLPPMSGDVPPPLRPTALDMDKVTSTLRQFVRDWSDEGAAERDATYRPICELLRNWCPDVRHRGRVRVLVPGAGLSRLSFDLALMGFACHGNEFSYHMLIAGHFVLNHVSTACQFAISPFVDSSSNLFCREDQYRQVGVPDRATYEMIDRCCQHEGDDDDGDDDNDGEKDGDEGPPSHRDAPPPPPGYSATVGTVIPPPPLAAAAEWSRRRDARKPCFGEFAMNAGDFIEVYSRAAERGAWDIVITCFFIDTSHNVLDYADVIQGALKPGGRWINLGPLLYHFSASLSGAVDDEGAAFDDGDDDDGAVRGQPSSATSAAAGGPRPAGGRRGRRWETQGPNSLELSLDEIRDVVLAPRASAADGSEPSGLVSPGTMRRGSSPRLTSAEAAPLSWLAPRFERFDSLGVVQATYAGNARSMKNIVYSCPFFTASKPIRAAV